MGSVIKAHVHLGALSFSSGGKTEQLHQVFFSAHEQDVCADAVMAGRFI